MSLNEIKIPKNMNNQKKEFESKNLVVMEIYLYFLEEHQETNQIKPYLLTF